MPEATLVQVGSISLSSVCSKQIVSNCKRRVVEVIEGLPQYMDFVST